ncbi:type VII secretion system-associated protein [Streptomyces sp. NPDC046557]|uniref:type VII secretion system-associated protein n=1 Tax=Streptomyces sp. NPDC046557 TaxID=3155372 RepID=UPI0033E8DFE8
MLLYRGLNIVDSLMWESSESLSKSSGKKEVGEAVVRAPVEWITEAMRAEASRNPDSWVYAIDPFVDPAGRIPPYAIFGAWKVDEQGEITDQFTPNSKYRPSPRSMGMAEPTDAVDAAIQLAATRYGSEADVVRALVGSFVFVLPQSVIYLDVRSEAVARKLLPVFTDPSHAPTAAPELRRVEACSLAAGLPSDTYFKINPGSSASVEIPVTDLQSWRAAQ